MPHSEVILRDELGYRWLIRGSSEFLGVKQDGIGYDIRHEIGTLKYLSEIACKACTFVDVGAQVGYYSVRLAKHYEKVIAIEPDNFNLEGLKRNLELNSIQNVYVVPKAITNRVGKEIFYCCGGGSKLGMYVHGNNKPLGIQDVETDLLDNVVEKAMAIKVDTEGYEAHVLEGAKRLIAERPIWIIEDHREIYHETLRPDYWSRILFLLQDYKAVRLEATNWVFKPYLKV